MHKPDNTAKYDGIEVLGKSKEKVMGQGMKKGSGSGLCGAKK